MATSSTLHPLVDSLVRIILTIIFFYSFKAFFNVQNDLLLAGISVLCAFVLFRSAVFAFRKFNA